MSYSHVPWLSQLLPLLGPSFPSESEMHWGVRRELPVTLAGGPSGGFFCNLGILLVVFFCAVIPSSW